MKALFNKLERAAERLINQLDDQTHDATLRVMTGDVFVHGKPPRDADAAPMVVTGENVPTPPSPRPEPVSAGRQDAPQPAYTPGSAHALA